MAALEDNLVTAADTIRSLRSRAKLTQSALAQLLEVDQMAVSRWERGVHIPTAAHRARLVEILGGDPRDYGREYA